MSIWLEIAYAGLFNAAVLFIVTAGLQLVFGVQRIVNLTACSMYALGAYFGATAVQFAIQHGAPSALLIPVLIVSGTAIGCVGLVVERLLRLVDKNEESLQLLLTYALVLVFQDVIRYLWGAQPKMLADVSESYGRIAIQGASIPIYGLFIILGSALTGLALWWFVERTTIGHRLRATAENPRMAEAMGINSHRVTLFVFLLGSILSTLGGALVAPTTVATLDMATQLIVEAFAVIVIGGLGSLSGALLGALIVGICRAVALAVMPEVEIMAIYFLVVAVLIVRPYGISGKAQ